MYSVPLSFTFHSHILIIPTPVIYHSTCNHITSVAASQINQTQKSYEDTNIPFVTTPFAVAVVGAVKPVRAASAFIESCSFRQ